MVAGLLEAFGHHQAVTEKKVQVPLAMPQQHLQIVLLTASQSSKSKRLFPKDENLCSKPTTHQCLHPEESHPYQLSIRRPIQCSIHFWHSYCTLVLSLQKTTFRKNKKTKKSHKRLCAKNLHGPSCQYPH